MHSLNPNDVNNKITNYFHRYFQNGSVNMEARLVDLGFESIDYLAFGAFLIKTMNKWFDITKVNKQTRICDIHSYLQDIHLEKTKYIDVKLDKVQQHAYASQLHNKDKNTKICSFVIHYLNLKTGINISLLEQSIEETLNNHYILNSKLSKGIDNDYYFEPAAKQSSAASHGEPKARASSPW